MTIRYDAPVPFLTRIFNCFLFLGLGLSATLCTTHGAFILRGGAGRIQKVTHSSGKQITFVRNGDGFIEQVIDPAGNSCHYAYDASGDLRAFYDRVTDPATQAGTQRFSYTAGTHYLTDLFDGKGVRAAKNYYDPDGRLYRTVDAQGKETVFTHNVAGRTETIKDRAGNITSYTYDTRGNVTETSLPDGTHMTTGYHVWSDGRMSELKEVETVTGLFSDGAGGLVQKTLTTRYAYEDAGVPPVNDGLLCKVTDPLGHSTYFAYDPRGNVLTVTDPLGHTTTNAYYPGTTLLQSTTDAEGNTTGFTYDAHGLLDHETRTVTVTDAAGATAAQTLVTDYDYDASGYLTKMTDARGHVTTYDNDVHGNRFFERTTRTFNGAAVPVVTEHAYDADDRLVKTWDAEHPRGGGFNPSSETVYDENGKPSVVYDALRRMTQMTYSTRGELQTTSYADGTSTSATYDADGRREFSYDRRGKAMQTVYDALGRVSESWFIGSVGDTAVRLSHSDYDAAGRVWKSTDANSHTTTYSYDNAGRRSAGRNAKGEVSQYAYDNAGNARFFTDARGQTVESVYDNVNRRVRTVFPVSAIVEGNTVRNIATETVTLYDELGRRVQEFEQSPVDAAFAARRSKRSVYDELGRLGAVVDAAGQATGYTYDELGNQLTQTDANQHTTSYSYDNLGRRKSRTLPGGQAEGLHYDTVGNMDAHVDFNGTTASYGYDPLNRLLRRTVAQAAGGAVAAPVSYTYTRSGRRETMTDASGVTTYHYDARDRLQSKATPQGTLGYSYDDAGSLLTIGTDTPDGAAMTYTHDVLNRLESVTDANTQHTDYVYDPVGNLGNVSSSNGVAHTYSYNGLNRLTGLTVSKAFNILANYDYTLYATGQRRSAAESGAGILPANPTGTRTRVWSYDTLWRLTNETLAGASTAAQNGSVTYALDAVGNRQSRTSTLTGLGGQGFGYDPNDRVTGDTYDANGNTKAGTASQLSTLNAQPLAGTDTYDTENRLIARTGATGSVQVTYDGDGHKVRESVTRDGLTNVTTYLVDEMNPTGYAQVIEEKTNGTLTRVYTYGHDLISQDALYGSAWHLAAYAYDGHGSVRFLTNESGQVTDTYDYDAFGNLIATAGGTPNTYLYCGEQLDGALGLYYLRARLMNPLTGKFWSADSFEGRNKDPQSLHKYLYTNGNPVRGIDPSGHAVQLPFDPFNNLVPDWVRRLGSKIGWEVSLYIYLGMLAHEAIQNEYVEQHEGNDVYIDSPLASISPEGRKVLGTKSRLRPDIADKSTREIYEIKPALNYAIETAVSNAWPQLREYIG